MTLMAEVITAHKEIENLDGYTWGCSCGWRAGLVDEHSTHLASELTKAEFGSVRDAKAKALRDAADDLTRLPYIKPGDPGRDEYERTLAVRRGNTDNWLRTRADALTKGAE